jgi:hypothetical protein
MAGPDTLGASGPGLITPSLLVSRRTGQPPVGGPVRARFAGRTSLRRMNPDGPVALYDHSSTLGQCGQDPPRSVCSRNLPGWTRGLGAFPLPPRAGHTDPRRTPGSVEVGCSVPRCGLERPVESSETADAVHRRGDPARAILSDHADPNPDTCRSCSLRRIPPIRRGMATWRGSADHDSKADEGRGSTSSGARRYTPNRSRGADCSIPGRFDHGVEARQRARIPIDHVRPPG